MEALLAGKPRSAVLGALRNLLDPLREHWGDPEGFIEAGLSVLARQGSLFGDDEADRELLDQLYRQVLRIRALYFRPITNPTALDNAYKELEAQASERHQTSQQVLLWLASRIQQAVQAYLNAPQGQRALDTVLRAVDNQRGEALKGRLGDLEQLSLGRINGVLSDLVRDVLGDKLGRLETAALSGYLLESLRAAARRPPPLGGAGDEAPEQSSMAGLLAALGEPTRMAELNDARARFGQMPEAERTKRFNAFRLRLARAIKDVAPYAPLGFEPFCQAVEAIFFPYPAPLEYVRAFVRPVYNSARQSTLFSEVTTPQGVQQRYETLVKARQGNPVLLELARAFAVQGFRSGEAGEENRSFVASLDLHKEFGWPTDVEALRNALARVR